MVKTEIDSRPKQSGTT